MDSFMVKSIKTDCPVEAQGTTHQEFMKNLSVMQNPPNKSKNFESNNNLKFKININLYIPLQTMLPSRGYL